MKTTNIKTDRISLNEYYIDPDMEITELSNGGLKHEKDKLQWSLIPWEALESAVRVLMYGAKKYKPENWKKVVSQDSSMYADALTRHIVAYQKGERKDAETGESPLASVICDALFLLWGDMEQQKRGAK